MKTRSNIASGLILILAGAWFLAINFYTSLRDFAFGAQTWPLQIIGLGALLAVMALVLWVPPLWIPGCIVAGIGGLLYWQNLTGNWASWAYTWALIPGFVGIGMLISGFLSRSRRQITGAGWNIFSSLVLFAIFGSIFGRNIPFIQYWPVLLILFGLVILGRGIIRRW